MVGLFVSILLQGSLFLSWHTNNCLLLLCGLLSFGFVHALCHSAYMHKTIAITITGKNNNWCDGYGYKALPLPLTFPGPLPILHVDDGADKVVLLVSLLPEHLHGLMSLELSMEDKEANDSEKGEDMDKKKQKHRPNLANKPPTLTAY